MPSPRQRVSSHRTLSARWWLLTLALVCLIGCASPMKKKPRDPFEQNRADGKFSCGEQIPPGQAPRH